MITSLLNGSSVYFDQAAHLLISKMKLKQPLIVAYNGHILTSRASQELFQLWQMRNPKHFILLTSGPGSGSIKIQAYCIS